MILALIVMGLLTWFVWYYTKQSKIGNIYTTRFFEESTNSSRILKQMKNDGISDDSMSEFASMEDRLIMIAKQYYPSPELARAQSDQIKARFPAYDFGYHDEILSKRSKFFDVSLGALFG
jgi:hypothetical protein